MNASPISSISLDGELVEICNRLKKMGFAQSQRIRMYGQEFEVTSNPFPEGTGISVLAVSKMGNVTRALPIPLPVLQMVRGTVVKGKAA